MKKFSDLSLITERYRQPHISLNSEWLDSATEDQLNRIIIGLNDGQGDHSFYTYKEVLDLIVAVYKDEYEVKNMYNPNMKPLDESEIDKTPSVIMKRFYEDLNGNMCDAAYFDTEYKIINWKFS